MLLNCWSWTFELLALDVAGTHPCPRGPGGAPTCRARQTTWPDGVRASSLPSWPESLVNTGSGAWLVSGL